MTLNDEGLFLGAATQLAKFEAGDATSTLDIDSRAEHILALLSVAYWRPIEPETLGHLRRASKAYSSGDKVLAHIHLAHSGLPRLNGDDQAPCRLFIADRLLAEGISPLELLEGLDLDSTSLHLLKANPDDLKHPGWPAGAPDSHGGQFRPKDGDGDTANPSEMPVADFSGGFHDAVIDAWMDYFKQKGIPAVSTPAIRVVGPNNMVVGYPDIISRGPGPGWTVYEIKTGDDPPLTGPQMAYLPALQVGGHIYSTDPRIRALGLEPGVPFPPMIVLIVFAPGPGKEYEYHRLEPPKYEK